MKKKNMVIIDQNSRCSGRDSNQETPEYKSQTVPARPTYRIQ
jgi:hypothetical protein